MAILVQINQEKAWHQALISIKQHMYQKIYFIAFEGSRETFFINNNYKIQYLKSFNEMLHINIKNNSDKENKRKDARILVAPYWNVN